MLACAEVAKNLRILDKSGSLSVTLLLRLCLCTCSEYEGCFFMDA